MDSRLASAGRRFLLALVVLLAASVFMLVGARPAEAHATLIASRPLPGEQLASSPGIVTIIFSEPVDASLSHASLSSPDGQHFDGIVPSPTEMQIPVPTNAIGVYQVSWTTVSSVDGHVLHGSFQFEVGVAQVASAPGAQSVTGPQSADLIVAALRTIEYLALLMAVGMVVVQELAGRARPLAWVRTRLWVPVAVALAAGAAAVTGDAANATGSVSLSSFLDYLGNGLPGSARMLHLGAEGIALLLALALVRPRYVLPPLALALVALAASGHAAAAQPRALTVGIDSVHLLAAGVWAGGVLALATLRPPGGWRGEAGRALLRRFSRVALPAFGLTALMGVLRATEELSGVGDLISSAYGRILDVKVLAIGAMVALSLLAWRRLRSAPRIEGAIAVVVIAATALLSSFPLPPARAAQAEASGAASTNAALPTPSDLTFGGRAGDTLVGLTVRPARPGPNTLWISLAASDATSSASASVTLQAQPLALTGCGDGCQSAHAQLRGGETITVQVGSALGGGSAVFHLPQLPALSGAALFAAANHRMHALQTVRIDEQLGPGAVPVASTYMVEAPNRMQVSVATGFQSVIIGTKDFSRKAATDPWQSTAITPLPLPYFIWDSASALGVRIIGQATVDGGAAQVVAFFEDSSLGTVWFQVWVGGDGMIRQASMDAPGHFMDHHYSAFNKPVNIQPPA